MILSIRLIQFLDMDHYFVYLPSSILLSFAFFLQLIGFLVYLFQRTFLTNDLFAQGTLHLEPQEYLFQLQQSYKNYKVLKKVLNRIKNPDT